MIVVLVVLGVIAFIFGSVYWALIQEEMHQHRTHGGWQ